MLSLKVMCENDAAKAKKVLDAMSDGIFLQQFKEKLSIGLKDSVGDAEYQSPPSIDSPFRCHVCDGMWKDHTTSFNESKIRLVESVQVWVSRVQGSRFGLRV